MAIKALDHVNLRTINLSALRKFYVEALQFESVATYGKRRGYWLSIDGKVLLHLIEAERTDTVSYPRIEHFALSAEGLVQVMDRLDRLNLAYNLHPVSEQGVVQLNLRDPDDNRLHLDFPIAEYKAGMAPRRLSLR